MHKPGNKLHGRKHEAAELSGTERRMAKPRRHEAAREKWRRAARSFRGLGARLRAKNELRHITRKPDGYQVRIIRGKKVIFSRHVGGLSVESLLEAMRLRDEGLRKLRRERLHPIPPEVLRALGLSSPVAGICRLEPQFAYRASFRTADGKKRGRSFYYRRVPETVAYAAAIAFLKQTLERKERGEL